MGDLLILGRLYLPLLFAILTFTYIFIVRKSAEKVEIPINIFSIIEFKLPISSGIVKKVLLIILTLILIGSYLTRDYSKLFPSELDMEVFYDEEGLKKTIDILTPDEKKTIGINYLDYDKYQAVYYDALDEKVKEILKCNDFFKIKNGIVHSSGMTTIKVEKINGFQNYYITESKGRLDHTCEAPNIESVSFSSSFDKINSSNDYLKPDLYRIFFNGEIILNTLYKQILSEGWRSNPVPFHHTVIGVTKIYLFPFPRYSNTLYLYKHDKGGLIPIAYAVYK
jgi:hypothetical protein